MARNVVNGNNYGVQAGTVNGGVTMRGGRVQINGSTEDEDGTENVVNGNNYGIQAGNVNGGITYHD